MFWSIIEELIDWLISCWWWSGDERGRRSWSGAFILFGLLLGLLGLGWLFWAIVSYK